MIHSLPEQLAGSPEVLRLISEIEVRELPGKLKTKAFTTWDEQEVAGYAFVMKQVFAYADQIPLTQNMICQLQRDLLQYADADSRHRGSPLC